MSNEFQGKAADPMDGNVNDPRGPAAPPLVTVVIPCYNREESAAEAVGSVLAQDAGMAFEVIAVDDGSQDRTLEVLRAISDPRLRVMSNPGPKGACGARNAGAAAGSGTWIAFQDSDDLWLPGKLARQMEAVARWEGNCVAVYCAMEIRDGEGRVTGSVPEPSLRPCAGFILADLVWGSMVSTQTLVVRRDVFEQVGGFDPEMPALQDWDLMLKVAQAGDVAFVDDELVVQRMSGNSITRSAAKRLEAQERILRGHAALWKNYPRAQAHHLYRIAGARRRAGDRARAAEAVAAACRLEPGILKYRAMAAYLRLLALLPQRRAGHAG